MSEPLQNDVWSSSHWRGADELLHPHWVFLKILAENEMSLNVLFPVFIVHVGWDAHAATVGAVVLLVLGLEEERVEVEHLVLGLPYLICK